MEIWGYNMKKKIPRKGKILTELERIRKHQILSSFDTIFLILVPAITLVIGYFVTNIEVVSAVVPRNFYFIFVVFALFIPLVLGIYGILVGSVKYRMHGWFILFVFLWTSFVFYTFTNAYWGVIPVIGGPEIGFIIGLGLYVGSFFMGYGMGKGLLHAFWEQLLFKRLKKIDKKIEIDFSLPKLDEHTQNRYGILIVIGFLIILLFLLFLRFLGAPPLISA